MVGVSALWVTGQLSGPEDCNAYLVGQTKSFTSNGEPVGAALEQEKCHLASFELPTPAALHLEGALQRQGVVKKTLLPRYLGAFGQLR